MSKDFHEKPFDEATKTKLELYQKYVEEWLPVFIKNKIKNINIFDFFCGPGQDNNGNQGSPLLTINTIKSFKKLISTNNVKINLFLNDSNSKKINLLMKFLESQRTNKIEYLNIKTTNQKFEYIFDQYYSQIMDRRNSANLIFIDQTGIKHVTSDRFLKIVNLSRTDFLFFISSSAIKRFIKEEGFRNHFGNISKEIRKAKPNYIHREVAKFYRSLIPTNTKIYLIPFTIKKGKNYYGLIFTTKHIRGADKFLRVCWDKDKITGDANFDIDNSKIDLDKPALFDEMNKSTKLNEFEKELKDKILKKNIKTNVDVYEYTISNAFLAKHAREVIKKLKKDNLIEKKVNISYDSCIKKSKEEIINVIK